jgi:phage shock protein PspC (stress-responsive transcriptional regulator)
MTEDEREIMREANRLACFVLDGQARNYAVMRQLLRTLWCLLVVTGCLFVLLLIEALR